LIGVDHANAVGCQPGYFPALFRQTFHGVDAGLVFRQTGDAVTAFFFKPGCDALDRQIDGFGRA